MRIERLQDGLRVLTPAKLNLYLEVGPKRADGFHDIDSIFQAVTLFDELEFRSAPGDAIRLEESGIAAGEGNLVFKAARALQQWAHQRTRRQSGHDFGAHILLKKRIPQGAGLGGGSSDAAATLVGLSSLWGLSPDSDSLLSIAAALGSDVPFFLVGGTARCRGRGEDVVSLSDAFSVEQTFYYVLAYPRLEVPTAVIYEKLDVSRDVDNALTLSSHLDSISATSLPGEFRCGRLFFNRLETVVYSAFPELKRVRARMAQHPFLALLVSGSGSTIYGVCRSAEESEEIAVALSAEIEADVFCVGSESSTGWNSSPSDSPSPHVDRGQKRTSSS